MLPGELVMRVVSEEVDMSPSAELKPSFKVSVKRAVTRESGPEVPVVMEEKAEIYTAEIVVTLVRVVTDVTQGMSKLAVTWSMKNRKPWC